MISRTKPVDLNSTLDNDSSSQKVELESKEVEPKEVESEEAAKEEQIVEEKQNEEIPEGPQLGENKEVEAETENDGTPPRKKQKVEEERIEDRQIEENSSDEEPEEVNLPFLR